VTGRDPEDLGGLLGGERRPGGQQPRAVLQGDFERA
jgi:hypothetical protein